MNGHFFLKNYPISDAAATNRFFLIKNSKNFRFSLKAEKLKVDKSAKKNSKCQ